ncbi:MAG: AAA family ATPase [Magnetococcales bacterium]|nr:AAA family ATPase [Magnetococcales bacterium]
MNQKNSPPGAAGTQQTSNSASHSSIITADKQRQAEWFLKTLASTGILTFQTFPDAKGAGVSQSIRHGTLEANKAYLVQQNEAGAGIFVTVNETDGKGRKAENIVAVRAVFVDLDGSPLEPVMSGPLSPHIVVATSPGKYHAYWLVEGVVLDHFKQIQQALVARFEGDKACVDLSRVMRMPGFSHRKKDPPFLVHLHHTAPGPRYSEQQILEAFGIEIQLKVAEIVHQVSTKEFPAIMQRHLHSIAAARQGERNNTVNRCSYFAGQLVAGGQDEEETRSALLDAVGEIVQADGEREEFERIVHRSMREGIKAGPPMLPETVSDAEAFAIDAQELEACLISLTEPAECPFHELPHVVERWIPCDEVTLLAGHGGAGKSYVAILIAIHVALGRDFG